MLKGKIL